MFAAMAAAVVQVGLQTPAAAYHIGLNAACAYVQAAVVACAYVHSPRICTQVPDAILVSLYWCQSRPKLHHH